MELGDWLDDTTHARRTPRSPHLIVLHLTALNQLRLLLNFLKLDYGPLFRCELFNLRFQICKEVTLRPDQRSEEIFVVV